ncbi:MAG: hypothetical protein JAZ13_07310 [Candidatus Thiodiazotropha taylori]|nr:hypothetical protein [Candidatus Thiodiazotropha taylori]
MSAESKDIFLKEAAQWICDKYSLDIRYYTIKEDKEYIIQTCSIQLHPLSYVRDNSFAIESDLFAIGQFQKNNMSRDQLLEFLNHWILGEVNINDKKMQLKTDSRFQFYSDMFHADSWYYNLHIKLTGSNIYLPELNKLREIDNQFRSATPPFDGLSDALSWLDLGGAQFLGSRPSEINISISPPTDIILEDCSLDLDCLTLKLKASPDFDTNKIQLAICPVPRRHVHERKQVVSEVNWTVLEDKIKEGIAKINLKDIDSVLVMLLINNNTVRRQWIIDTTKARNNRQLTVQHFDKNLKMLRKAIFDLPDSNKFEEGVALLLFIMGFTPAVQIETDSPDLIVYTPIGKLILVECTMRISDFSAKVGKLVDRRGSLEKLLKKNAHDSMVYSALICRLPKDQIASLGIDLHENKIILLTKEDLEQGFTMIRNGVDPDKLIIDALNNMVRNNKDLN